MNPNTSLSLTLAIVTPCNAPPNRDATIGIEASCLALAPADFARLSTSVWCGTNGGMSGFDDSKRRFICPTYGQA